MTGDTGELYNEHRKIKQARQNDWFVQNTQIIQAGPFSHVLYPTVIHIKAPHTFVLFYPHTGRWQVKGFKNMHSGGAKKCLEWLQNIEQKETERLERLR